ncbi:MAG: hypothetical protein QOH21_3207 [Acidobacteriota bacterium]|jgi:hypothetical protein|nr:hypothetical protein [Acidobacteriota bacterium]
MKAIHERADARWLPSRHNFAFFRLVAFVRLRNVRPQPERGLLLMVDRHQSQMENYSLSVWVMATVTCFIAGTLFGSRHVALAFALAVPTAVVGLQVAIVGTGLLVELFSAVTGVKVHDSVRASSAALMLLFLGTSAWVAATSPTWVRWAAWQVLALVALNAIAAMLLFLLRAPIARAERTYDEFGGSPSGK